MLFKLRMMVDLCMAYIYAHVHLDFENVCRDRPCFFLFCRLDSLVVLLMLLVFTVLCSFIGLRVATTAAFVV